MKEVRVYKTIQYWVDVEIDDNATDVDALDAAMEIDMVDWEFEITDEGVIED